MQLWQNMYLNADGIMDAFIHFHQIILAFNKKIPTYNIQLNARKTLALDGEAGSQTSRLVARKGSTFEEIGPAEH